jgi:hypothetical protein
MVTNRITTRKKGKVGLWVDSGDGYFRNLKITPAKKSLTGSPAK